MTHGYEGDDESNTSPCELHHCSYHIQAGTVSPVSQSYQEKSKNSGKLSYRGKPSVDKLDNELNNNNENILEPKTSLKDQIERNFGSKPLWERKHPFEQSNSSRNLIERRNSVEKHYPNQEQPLIETSKNLSRQTSSNQKPVEESAKHVIDPANYVEKHIKASIICSNKPTQFCNPSNRSDSSRSPDPNSVEISTIDDINNGNFPVTDHLDVSKTGSPWATATSQQFVNYAIQRHDFNYIDDLKIAREIRQRMVLEPKFIDYGSIHPTSDSHHSSHLHQNSLLSPRAVLLPPLDDQDATPTTSDPSKMTQADLYQRQPLLSNQNGDHWNHNGTSSVPDFYNDEDDDDIMEKSTGRNGDITIELPVPRGEEPRFPQERCKTLLAGIIMCFNFILTLTSLSLVHERVPDREVYGPLPDAVLDNVPAYDWALDVSEYIIIFCINSCIIAMVFHKHRFIVFRRIFLIMSLLYMYRAITMYVTVLPLSSRTYHCSPKSNETSPLLIAKRVLHLMSGFGLSVNGKHTFCGDFIYSGHTVILIFSYLCISEYTPKKIFLLKLVHWMYFILGIIGVIMLQLSHGHYTVDVIIAYYITTRIFWIYHTLANNSNLKQYSSNNLLSRSWWFALFLYFEGNVGGPVPRQFDWPLPWPRRWHSKSRAS